MENNEPPARLWLDDLTVGQEFLSDAHALDAGQIIAIALATRPGYGPDP